MGRTDDLISRAAAIDAIECLHGGCITDDVKNFMTFQVLSVPAVDAIPVEWLERKLEEALQEGMRPDEVHAVEMVLWMWQKEQGVR